MRTSVFVIPATSRGGDVLYVANYLLCILNSGYRSLFSYKFITAGLDDPDAVRPEIIQSWKRCHAAVVDPFTISGRMILDAGEVEDLIDWDRDFIEIARHFMTKLYEFVKGSGFIVLLSNEQGCIMEVIGDQDTLVNAARINLIRGSIWDERYVGTNGVGTVLMLLTCIPWAW